MSLRHTHDLRFDNDLLIKRYTDWARGEHEREWQILNRINQNTSDLVPIPSAQGLSDVPPWISMSRLPGDPLTGPLSPAQTDALELALRQMWAVPTEGLPPRRYWPQECLDVVRGWFAAAERPPGVAGAAFDATVTFLGSAVPPPPGEPVLGHSDPNLANYLWDGERVRIVDFEDAGLSEMEYELATIAEHLSARDSTDWDAFLARFDPEPQALLFGRRLMAALWAYFLLPGNGAERRNPPGTREWQATRTLTLYS
jgi:aminoglycoside phosphotransferase (APT) family kinase protein